MKRIAFLTVLLLIVGVVPFAMKAPNGPLPNVDICHFDGQGVGHVISVSGNALPAHLEKHGDCIPGDPGVNVNDDGTCTCPVVYTFNFGTAAAGTFIIGEESSQDPGYFLVKELTFSKIVWGGTTYAGTATQTEFATGAAYNPVTKESINHSGGSTTAGLGTLLAFNFDLIDDTGDELFIWHVLGSSFNPGERLRIGIGGDQSGPNMYTLGSPVMISP